MDRECCVGGWDPVERGYMSSSPGTALPVLWPCWGLILALHGARWVRVFSFSRGGDQTGGVAARLLLPASELGNSHLSLGLLLHGKGWVLKLLPVVWSQAGADSPCKEGCQSQKGTVCLWAAPSRRDCVCWAQREPGRGHPGEIHPLPQVMGTCCARSLLVGVLR